MKSFKFSLFLILLLTTVYSCIDIEESDQTCKYSGYAFATEVTGPATAIANEEITFAVKINIGNACGVFSKFETSSGFPKEVGAVVDYNGCNCPNQNNFVTKEYKYTPTQEGEFQFKFISGSNTHITKTVTVTE